MAQTEEKSSKPEETVTSTETTTSPKSKKEAEVVTRAMQYFVSGKRNLLIQDIPGATSSLEEACRLLGEHYGETAKECGEPYFYYGKALLELARLESGVIDNAFDGVDEEEREDSNDDSRIGDPNDVTEGEAERIFEQVDDALIENCQKAEEALKKNKKKEVNGNEAPQESKEEAKDSTESDSKSDEDEAEKEEEEEEEEEGGDGEEVKEKEGEEKKEEEKNGKSDNEEEEEEAKETESIGSNEAGTSNAKDDKDKVAVDKEEEDDPSNLQLAWEMLELAKGIFQKHADSFSEPTSEKRLELESKLSETFQLLGEVSIENENYEQAVEDLNSCLRRREELLPSDSRCIAETHYQLGVALGFNLQFDRAVQALESSIAVLESRISNLKQKTESQDPSKKDDAFYTREKEIEEIEKLIPEIKEKIVDTRDMQEETLKKIREQNPFSSDQQQQNGNNEEGKPVSNITSLVKKRKKSGEETESDSKKPHLENGTSSSNGGGGEETSNGTKA